MKLLRRINVCLGLAGLLPVAASPVLGQWEFLTNVPGSRYTYDLTTTPRAVYITLGDTVGNSMGLYRYDRLTAQTEFVGKPDDPIYGVHVAGACDEHIWLGSRGDVGEENYLWHSSNAGESWELQLSGAYGEYFAIDGWTAGSSVYIGPNGTLCLESSTDFGNSWMSWGGCTNHMFGVAEVKTDFWSGNRAYAAIHDWSTESLIVIETTNGGETWEQVFVAYGGLPSFGGAVYPSPYCEGDVAVVNEIGDVFSRVQEEWIDQGYANLVPNFGVVQPRWDGGTWWTAGGNEYDQLRVKRKVGDVWTYWDVGLPQVPGESTLHLGRLWACPVNGQLFLTLPEHG
ncbi:MAG: hypothetical protein GF355_14380, partial [Candidatus Eisenbacteria bacterium]|nr:hypothetical protein [Candidatus Eisenbacteria bacterium]